MRKGEINEREEGKKPGETLNMHQTLNELEKMMKETSTSTKADPKREERKRN
jgi:hypothetical protein